MTFQPGANVYTQGFGSRPENVEVPHYDVRTPTTTDIGFPLGKRWVNYVGNSDYTLTSFSTSGNVTTANWALLGTTGGALNTLTGDSGGAISPSAGNITLAGTSSQIATAGSGSTITFSLDGPYTPATYTAHGVLLGEGSSSIVATAAGTDGQVLIAATGADPAFATITSSGSTLTLTGGANTLNIDIAAPVSVANGGTGVTAITAHDLIVGNGTSAVTLLAPSATSGVAVVSQGAASDPHYGTVVVAGGGTGATTLTSHGVLVGAGTSPISGLTAGTNGQVMLGSTGANPAFGTLTTSTGIAYTTGAASLAINLQQGGYAIDAASTGVALVAQNAYTVTQAAQTSFSLPATASVGDMFLIASGTGNTSGWIITQGASQEIWAGTNHTTNGASGTLAGAIHTSVIIMCVIANNEFIIVGGSGLTGLTFT